MVGVAPDVGRGRRLPVWMLGVAAADQVRTSDNGSEKNNTLEEGFLSQACQSKANAPITQPEKEVIHEKETVELNSHVLPKCENKRKRKSSRKKADCDGNINETVSEKEKNNGLQRKVPAAAPEKSRRRKEKCSRFGSSEEFEIPSPNGDDAELTMEDLMSIAEEYVKASKDMEQQQSSNREYESENILPTTNSSRDTSGGSLGVPNRSQGSPTHETMTSYNSTARLTSEGIVGNARKTGDPAQDMLDLFLGPLLKKPLEEEKKTGFISTDLAFACEFKKLIQNDVREEMVIRTKKKSSLKDTVAMFLD